MRDVAGTGRIALRFIGGHLHWRDMRFVEGAFKEGLRGRGISPLGAVRIDNLAILIDGAVDVRPVPVEAGVRFINPPFVLARISVGSS